MLNFELFLVYLPTLIRIYYENNYIHSYIRIQFFCFAIIIFFSSIFFLYISILFETIIKNTSTRTYIINIFYFKYYNDNEHEYKSFQYF